HPYLTSIDLTTIKQECILQSLQDAHFQTIEIKHVILLYYLENLSILASDQNKFRFCLKQGVSIALQINATQPSAIIEHLYLELNCFIFGINKDELKSKGSFHERVLEIKSLKLEPLSENVCQSFYELNITIFDAVLKLKRSEYLSLQFLFNF